MCGIIGYIGPKDVVPVLIDGLRRLEYRGYDSAGVAVVRGGGIELLLGTAPATVQVPMLGCLLKVIRLAPVGPVVVSRQAELFEEVEGAIDGGGGGARIVLPHALHELRTGGVPVRCREHVDDDLALVGPALPALPEGALQPLGQPSVRRRLPHAVRIGEAYCKIGRAHV